VIQRALVSTKIGKISNPFDFSFNFIQFHSLWFLVCSAVAIAMPTRFEIVLLQIKGAAVKTASAHVML